MMRRAAAVSMGVFLTLSAAQAQQTVVDTELTNQPVFEVYGSNRELGLGNYITADLLLLAYSMIRQRTLAELEEQQIRPLLEKIVGALSASTNARSGDSADQANGDYLAVLAALQAGRSRIQERATAQQELDLILAAEAIAPSPLWGRTMDYTQFKPRGRYDASETLARYFRLMRYAGAALFAVQPSAATGVASEDAERMAQQAVRLASLLTGDSEAAGYYLELEKLLAWQFGAVEDLTASDVVAAASDHDPSTRSALREVLFEYARAHERQPGILDGIIDKSRLEADLTPADALTGWRLLPARYAADTGAMQVLVYDSVGEYEGDCDHCARPDSLTLVEGRSVKGFPMARELLALLGSQKAQEAMVEYRDAAFEGYSEASRLAAERLGEATGLTGGLLMVMAAGLQDGHGDDRDPTQTVAAFWTWQRYINLLYAKQSYTLSGKAMSAADTRPGGSIEPATPLYLALAEVVTRHRRHTPHPDWEQFSLLLSRCIELSWRVQQGTALSAQEGTFLNKLDQDLLALSGGPDAPIVVDVHSNPASGEVLQQAVGYAKPVPGPKETRGARMTHYEFRQPMEDRLTNDEWRALLSTSMQPAMAPSVE